VVVYQLVSSKDEKDGVVRGYGPFGHMNNAKSEIWSAA
jgi:hypothetical protein